MAVSDRWHKSRPSPDEPKCKEHTLVPSAEHGIGDRWQVRRRGHPKKNFRLKVGKNPEIHAEAYDAAIAAGAVESEPTSVEDKRSLTIQCVGESWLASRIVEESTQGTMFPSVRKHILSGHLGSLAVWDLYQDPNSIQVWIKLLLDSGLKKSTVSRISRHLSSILTYARWKDIIPSNPMQGNPLITIPTPDKRVAVAYTPEQLSSITSNLKEKFHTVLRCGSELGLRIGEINGLSPDDLQNREVQVNRQIKVISTRDGNVPVFALPKRGKTRVVPLPDSLSEFLSTLPTSLVTLPWQRVAGKPITVRTYLSDNGRLFSRRSYDDAWDAALAASGIPSVAYRDKFHRLRHTYASRLLREGIDIRSLAEYLGHDDPAFTLKRYCHFMRGSGDDVRRIFDVPG